jgi:hypothetical protein
MEPENCFFTLFWGIWAPPNGPKKVHRGPQVGRMYVPMFKVENRPLIISTNPFFKKKWSGATRKKVFCAVLGHLGTPKLDQKGAQKPASRRDLCPNV